MRNKKLKLLAIASLLVAGSAFAVQNVYPIPFQTNPAGTLDAINQVIAAVNPLIISGGSGGSGTVTSTSVTSANGFGGSVATATTTPAITITTSCNGVCKGNGTAISTATANSDYQGAITLTTTGTSGAATLTGAALNIPQYSSSTFQQAMAAETQMSLGGL